MILSQTLWAGSVEIVTLSINYGVLSFSKGLLRALKGGSRCPLLVTISKDTFPNSWSVSLLGALHALYVVRIT